MVDISKHIMLSIADLLPINVMNIDLFGNNFLHLDGKKFGFSFGNNVPESDSSPVVSLSHLKVKLTFSYHSLYSDMGAN